MAWLGYAGTAFDQLTLAGGLATEVIEGILERNRADRLVLFSARDAANPTLDEVIRTVVNRTWGAPVAVNRDASVAAFTPTLHVRADGRIGLLHYDLRSNTASTASLLADLWLLSSSDGVTWTETAVKRAFNLATAPTASNGALFLGDYQGLTSSGNVFVPLAVLPNADLNNRTDVIAQRIESLTANSQQALTRFGARAELPTISPGQREAFAAAHAEATRRALQLRRPGPAPRAAR